MRIQMEQIHTPETKPLSARFTCGAISYTPTPTQSNSTQGMTGVICQLLHRAVTLLLLSLLLPQVDISPKIPNKYLYLRPVYC